MNSELQTDILLQTYDEMKNTIEELKKKQKSFEVMFEKQEFINKILKEEVSRLKEYVKNIEQEKEAKDSSKDKETKDISKEKEEDNSVINTRIVPVKKRVEELKTLSVIFKPYKSSIFVVNMFANRNTTKQFYDNFKDLGANWFRNPYTKQFGWIFVGKHKCVEFCDSIQFVVDFFHKICKLEYKISFEDENINKSVSKTVEDCSTKVTELVVEIGKENEENEENKENEKEKELPNTPIIPDTPDTPDDIIAKIKNDSDSEGSTKWGDYD